MERKTPLYEMHRKYHGKMVPFAGYLLPIQYEEGIIKEHMAVRTGAGLFDVSHMGEIICKGTDALENLQRMLTNDFTGMADGQARYSPMCNEMGGTVDDLIVYKKKAEEYFIVVNASNKEKDYRWMLDHKFGEVVFEDISDDITQIALQGPKSQEILRKLTGDIPEKYYYGNFNGRVAQIPCIVSRTGYTGEDGFELYLDNTYAETMWETLMEAGKEYGLIPCGLGARDTLRLEAGMPLYGHEMNDEINPVETGLGFAVKMKKEDFIGKSHLPDKDSLLRKRVGLKVTGRGIIREQEEVLVNGKKAGFTTSGTHCPYLGYPAAMAILDKEYAIEGTKVTVIVRGRDVEAEVVPLPFYKKSK
ncbi:glycine cleavage system aminomethyltransferase GcvT [Lacrimispora saccharolytica]|uniref:Aminomethyltransferase n=1 Tax=Lacrimispora saccharolytica (strain ATCC 35040 / DSM 2544 / NRCC 2533 / WM1) TaxID=610130 RepID=D9R9S3_LACSW|nr:glycine cleavage system aminomethyltransferase GcvT [Lacrimispora saccharolytica]ADL04123.1 glycine cleavage system T protein [[Clostridium] saccharolyticum WM1]QRV21587.1 glycine cleavage system aminomethyltransferase GcvT [Lacrimispora saccharolytica]